MRNYLRAFAGLLVFSLTEKEFIYSSTYITIETHETKTSNSLHYVQSVLLTIWK